MLTCLILCLIGLLRLAHAKPITLLTDPGPLPPPLYTSQSQELKTGYNRVYSSRTLRFLKAYVQTLCQRLFSRRIAPLTRSQIAPLTIRQVLNNLLFGRGLLHS